MNRIVLGIGTSHSPVLAMEGRFWADRAMDDVRRTDLALVDGRVLDYAQLLAEVDGRYADEATVENFEREYHYAQRCLDELAATVAAAAVDVLIVIGDDQYELFSSSHNPAFAIYTGDEIVMHPKTEVASNLAEWHVTANKGYSMDRANRHRADSELAVHLVEGLITRGVDVSVAGQVKDPYEAGFGHAFGFVAERFIKGQDIAIVPIMLNTYFPPNVPTPTRCFDIGVHLSDVIGSLPGDRRVGIVASGGLSHFVINDELDKQVLQGLKMRDRASLTSIAPHSLRSGNSEILNWIMAGGALARHTELAVTMSEYIAVRRTPAGTGIGLGFQAWQ